MNEDRATRFHRLHRRAIVLAACLTAGLLVALGPGGLALWVREQVVGVLHTDSNAPATVAAFVILLAVAHEAITLPVTMYRTFFLERRYGLSTEPLRRWAQDHAKAALVALALGLAGAEIVYASLRSWPRWWWVASAAAFILGGILIARVAPTLLLPLFYRFTPLERESLRTRLETLSKRAGVPVLGVYVWGLGDKTRRANAALVGTGSTRRILLSDTLLADYTDDEIEVILAHELGHHANRDIQRALVLDAALTAGVFAVCAAALEASWRPLRMTGPDDAAGLPVLLLIAGAMSLAMRPWLNAISRRHEHLADQFALRLTHRPGAFISAMRRLAAQNLAEERPSAFVRWLFHTHPPIEERIDRARRRQGARA